MANIKATIGGASKDIESGYVNIGGVWKELVKGYSNIGGVWKEIALSSGTSLSTLAVGTSVYMNVNGARTEWIIVHQGIPSTEYDTSCNGTWLLTKDIYEKRAYNSYNRDNDYENSVIHSYLNDTFINLFDSNIKSVIKQVKVPYTKGTASTTVLTGSSGISAKIFLLSHKELNLPQTSSNQANVEGVTLLYFNGAANSKRIAYFNGAAEYWYTRSPHNANTNQVMVVTKKGGITTEGYGNKYGIRPALVLPSDTVFVDDNMNVITE